MRKTAVVACRRESYILMQVLGKFSWREKGNENKGIAWTVDCCEKLVVCMITGCWLFTN